MNASSATTSSATTSSGYHLVDYLLVDHLLSTTSGPRRRAPRAGRRWPWRPGAPANAPLQSSAYGLRDINPVWRVLLPRLAEKARLDWRSPDAPFWVIQSKNTANNGVKYHAGRLLATYESGCAYELELGPELRTLGPCDFDGTLKTFDFWTDTMTAHAKTCATTGEMIAIGYNLVDVDGVVAVDHVVRETRLPRVDPTRLGGRLGGRMPGHDSDAHRLIRLERERESAGEHAIEVEHQGSVQEDGSRGGDADVVLHGRAFGV